LNTDVSECIKGTHIILALLVTGVTSA